MERKMIYQDDAIDAIVGCTNCGTEDELRAYVTRHSLEDVWSGGIVDALDAIEQLPSARPERKTGKWITHYYKLGTERYECNVCHNRIGDTPYYCPNCGADMRGEQDG